MRSCPHCGLTEGKGYGGTPACQAPYTGTPPVLPHCLLAKQMIETGHRILGTNGR